MGTQHPLHKKGAHPPIFGPCLLWPNGWMDQDATWYNGRPQPGNIVLDADPPLPRGTAPSLPKKGPCLLWQNGRPSQLLLSTCYVVLWCVIITYFVRIFQKISGEAYLIGRAIALFLALPPLCFQVNFSSKTPVGNEWRYRYIILKTMTK